MQIQAISLSDVFEIEKSKIPIVIILSVVQCTIIFEVDLTFASAICVFSYPGSFYEIRFILLKLVLVGKSSGSRRQLSDKKSENTV